jgi:tRNA(Ile)-lysidine synthase
MAPGAVDVVRARVREAMAALRPSSPGGAWRVLVACSGGPDSRALLDALVALREPLGLELGVAAVDHGLRAEAAGECARVAEVARAAGAAAHVLTVTVGRGGMAAARAARYRALIACAQAGGYEAIAAAHTATDQVETLLDRLIRGAGTRGLSAMAAARPAGGGARLVRPLLDVSRAEVDAYVAARALDVARDPTNDDRRYRRARLRHDVLPLLRRERADFDRAAAELCARLRGDADALDAAAGAAYARLRAPDATLDVAHLVALPTAIAARVLQRAASHVLDARHIDAVLRLCATTHGTRALDLGAGLVAERRYDRLRFGPAPEDPGDVLVRVPAPGRYAFLGAAVDVPPAAFGAGELVLRNVRPGDRLRLGDRVTKVQDILVNAKVPRPERRRVPLLVRREMSGVEEVLWIPGVSRALTGEGAVQ